VAERARQRLTVGGVVQGVGFRPFAYALARELGLAGSVANTSAGVVIEVEGERAAVAEFHHSLTTRAPAMAQIDALVVETTATRGGTAFVIEESQPGGGRTLVSPDIATCEECRHELGDPADRRYRHPFISCTNCGPRFSVITGLPYDRPATTMAPLPLCRACAAEYADPDDRRFHAQTVACPDCGPELVLHRPGQSELSGGAAVSEARRLLSGGAIVAVKGLGGYHLACDATDDSVVTTLRKRKDRGDKPFALMVRDLGTATRLVNASATEVALLTDARHPVVLIARRSDPGLELAVGVSPDSPDLGVMLPYTPLHHLLFGLPGDPVGPEALVMTSGNVAGEPIVTDDAEARLRLAPLADAWLSHDRQITVPCDDSVLRVVAGEQLPVRRSRGYAPLPIALPISVRPALAVGSDLKNTFCVGEGRYAWLSAHVGDMDDLATLTAFDNATDHLSTLTGVHPEVLVADRHPAYRSTAWAERHRPTGVDPAGSLRKVQHHHAHIASAMAENGYCGGEPVIGFAFDGTGYGDDGAVWGGEVLVADYTTYERAGHLRYALLPGGDAGVRNPCRMALSHLHAAGMAWDPALPCVAACPPTERAVLAHQLDTGLNCVPTSSMGRLFDAMSSLAGVCHRVAYEAEAAMRFEGLARTAVGSAGIPYGFAIEDAAALIADPSPVLQGAAADVLADTDPGLVAARFHLAVADLVGELAVITRDRTGHNTVALSGGVFLNALLTELCVTRLSARGFDVLTHHRVPPSDAGIALGQLVVGAHLSTEDHREQRRLTCV